MKNENENLQKQLEQFLGSQKANKTARDIERGDELFKENPAPEVSEIFLSRLKTETQFALMRKRARRFRHKMQWGAFAAAAVVVVFLVMNFFGPVDNQIQRGEVETASVIKWDNGSESGALADYRTQMKEIDNHLQEVKWSQPDTDVEDKYEQLESDFADIESRFWKG